MGMGTSRRNAARKSRSSFAFSERLIRAAVAETLEIRRLLSAVSGAVFNDLNGNGARDEGEPGETDCSFTPVAGI